MAVSPGPRRPLEVRVLARPGALLLLLGLLRAVGAVPREAACIAAALLCLIIVGGMTVIHVAFLILAAADMPQDGHIGPLLWVLGGLAVGAAAWYLVKNRSMSLSHPDDRLRDATRNLADEAAGRDESELRAFCDAHVEALYVKSTRFRRSVHHGTRRTSMEPEGVLRVYRQMLYEALLQSTRRRS